MDNENKTNQTAEGQNEGAGNTGTQPAVIVPDYFLI